MNITNRPSILLVALAAGTLLTRGLRCQRAPAGSTDREGGPGRRQDREQAKQRRRQDRGRCGRRGDYRQGEGGDPGRTGPQDACRSTSTPTAATVTLSGTVDNADLRERAKQIATSTSGVKGVVDQLTVKMS